MKTQIRNGLFETNSSSVHSITMCADSDFKKWERGELIFNRDDCTLVPLTNEDYIAWKKEYDECMEKYGEYDDYYMFLTYDQFFNDWDIQEYETFTDSYTSPHGDKITAFGYYGHD